MQVIFKLSPRGTFFLIFRRITICHSSYLSSLLLSKTISWILTQKFLHNIRQRFFKFSVVTYRVFHHALAALLDAQLVEQLTEMGHIAGAKNHRDCVKKINILLLTVTFWDYFSKRKISTSSFLISIICLAIFLSFFRRINRFLWEPELWWSKALSN